MIPAPAKDYKYPKTEKEALRCSEDINDITLIKQWKGLCLSGNLSAAAAAWNDVRLLLKVHRDTDVQMLEGVKNSECAQRYSQTAFPQQTSIPAHNNNHFECQ